MEKRSEGLSVFIVDLRDVGDRLKVKRRRVMMNNFTNELEFDGVEVPARNLIGDEGKGLR